MNKKNKTKKSKQKRNQSLRAGTTSNKIYGMTFPREMKVTMRYVENLLRTPASGLGVDYVFNLNSIFDPDQTGTGHQPLGRDQWSNFYGRYRVDATKVHVKVAGQSSGYLTLLANNTSAAITSSTDAAESPISNTIAYSSGGSAVSLTRMYNLADVTGVTRSVYDADDRYQASFGASPTEVLCLHTVWVDANLGTGAGEYHIELDYFVTMFDPIQQSQS